jgi:hypothetical protein
MNPGYVSATGESCWAMSPLDRRSSPLVCASGVTGSDLKRRIEAIVTNRAARNLDTRRRILLIAAGSVALIGPIG